MEDIQEMFRMRYLPDGPHKADFVSAHFVAQNSVLIRSECLAFNALL